MIRKAMQYFATVLLGVVLGVILAATVGVNRRPMGDRWILAVVLDDQGEPVTKLNWHELLGLKGRPRDVPSDSAKE